MINETLYGVLVGTVEENPLTVALQFIPLSAPDTERRLSEAKRRRFQPMAFVEVKLVANRVAKCNIDVYEKIVTPGGDSPVIVKAVLRAAENTMQQQIRIWESVLDSAAGTVDIPACIHTFLPTPR
jgi:hypothetical protein